MNDKEKLSEALLSYPITREYAKTYTKQPMATRVNACHTIASTSLSIDVEKIVGGTYLTERNRHIENALIRSLYISIARGRPVLYELPESYLSVVQLLFNKYVYRSASKLTMNYEKAAELIINYNHLKIERMNKAWQENH